MYQSLSQSSGIYKIICASNGKIYIGSATNLRKRIRNHCSGLKTNTHPSRYLQAAWNKYGEGSFRVEIVEFVMPFMLLDREQYWLDFYQSYNREIGFNTAKYADAPTRGRITSKRGTHLTDEVKQKLRDANLGKRHSSETKRKMSIAQKGKKMSPEAIAKTVAARERNWIVITPDGDEILIRNLQKFCIEHGLNRGNMISVAQGKRLHNKGWKCRYA